jgi:hypothetical protein
LLKFSRVTKYINMNIETGTLKRLFDLLGY